MKATADVKKMARSERQTLFLLAGLTECFEELYLMLCRRSGRVPLLYRRRNLAKRRTRQDELPADTVACIREYKRYDGELYQYTRELFAEQVRLQGRSSPFQLRWFRLWNGLYAPYRKVRSFSLRHYLRNTFWDGASVATTTQEE